jgi:uncharacterized RDD family membrane protein YckC
VSEIPIGSPPVPPGRHAAPGGWYSDPVDPSQERYWDGWQWSRTTRPRESGTRAGLSLRRDAAGGVTGEDSSVDVDASAGGSYGRPQLRPEPHTSDGVPLAGWGWRLLAVLIDNMIVSTVTAVVLGPIYLHLVRAVSEVFRTTVEAARTGQRAPAMGELISGREQLIVIGVSLAVQLIYLVVFWRWKAATPGKLVCGLRIVPFDHGRSREPLRWQAILIRAAIWVLPAAQGWLFPLKLIDGVYPLFHPQRLAIHDLAARTQVVKVR